MTDLPCDSEPKVSSTPRCCVQIETGARLHFGLLDTVDPFGGVGVMIDQPATRVAVSPSDRFDCELQHQIRIRDVAARIAEFAQLSELPRCQIAIESHSPVHCGLGSGTQLALATVEAVCRCLSVRCDPMSIASEMAMRGRRSAVGVHGYFRGGLIFEGPQNRTTMNAVRGRVELPGHWCVGLFRPRQADQGVSGELESDQFARLSPASETARSALNRSVQQIMKAGKEGHFGAFASAVQQYNYESGMLFQAVQGGPYNGSGVSDLISELIDRGVQGVGQSSWGPGVFAWFESQEDAQAIANQLPPERYWVAVTRPRNRPRTVRESPL